MAQRYAESKSGEKRLRILYIAYYYFPSVSASTWSTHAITKRFAKKYEVTLLIPNINHEKKLENNTTIQEELKNSSIIIRTPKIALPQNLSPLISPFFLLLRGIMLGKNANMIFCQFQPHHFTYIVGIILGKIFRIPVIARADDVHRDMGVQSQNFLQKMNDTRRTIFNTLNELFVKTADAFFVVCSENRDILEWRLGKLQNIKVSYNGVDLDTFKECNKIISRDVLKIEHDKKLILFIGRFSGPEYRIEVLINAFNIVQDEFPKSMLYLVGDTIPNSIKNKNVMSSNVMIFGPVSRNKIKHFIAAADVCIGPLGSTKAIPLKVVEYMACGKPIVTGINSVSRDLAVDKSNLVIVSPKAQTVAASIIQIFSDEEYAQNLGMKASNTVLKFSWDRIVSDLSRDIMETVEK